MFKARNLLRKLRKPAPMPKRVTAKKLVAKRAKPKRMAMKKAKGGARLAVQPRNQHFHLSPVQMFK